MSLFSLVLIFRLNNKKFIFRELTYIRRSNRKTPYSIYRKKYRHTVFINNMAMLSKILFDFPYILISSKTSSAARLKLIELLFWKVSCFASDLLGTYRLMFFALLPKRKVTGAA